MIRPLRRSRRVKESEKGVAFITRNDGKEICTKSEAGKQEYRRRTDELAARQGNRCAMCDRQFYPDWPPTMDHQNGRGAGKRDDRTLINGAWNNAALCFTDQGIKGSRKYEWYSGEYREVVRER